MMELETKYFGTMTIDAAKIIHFPQGIPGFLDETEFILLDMPHNPVFQILQSIRTAAVAFVVTNPYHFYKDYSFALDDAAVKQLALEDEKDVAVYAIVTLQDTLSTSTLNLKAPLVINVKKKYAQQYVLDKYDYPIKAPITTHTEVKGE
ncbi:flagellar assembly protein FliW [Virgibacillus sp. 179-BFC.A HS]|uniref:Flagellar assembly factor FliW n=1 Tax=Tigheibacillus jepli TaxID=3035914 RepID=A0ABU5CFM8_9BACI|nr:flagellar assembly protein FliW [Virgibacillus sp. 179-BFC.A HS]MDY0405091.1 flagellar assembly protein FliW [Virgibacillus sp. 179-BFC.A HS]